jgi:hypothetical protein
VSRRKPPPITLAGSHQQVLIAGEAVDPFEGDKKITVMRNAREHSISYLHHQKVIDDDQLIAANEFRRRYEAAMLGASQAIDYSRIRVDGGVVAEPLTERMQEAHKWLAEASSVPGVGLIGYALLVNVCGESRSLKDVASGWKGVHAPGSSRMAGYISARLCEALDAVNAHFGLIAVGKTRRR